MSFMCPIMLSALLSALKKPSPQLSRHTMSGQHVTLAVHSHDAFHLLSQLDEWGFGDRERGTVTAVNTCQAVLQRHNKLLANAGVW